MGFDWLVSREYVGGLRQKEKEADLERRKERKRIRRKWNSEIIPHKAAALTDYYSAVNIFIY